MVFCINLLYATIVPFQQQQQLLLRLLLQTMVLVDTSNLRHLSTVAVVAPVHLSATTTQHCRTPSASSTIDVNEDVDDDLLNLKAASSVSATEDSVTTCSSTRRGVSFAAAPDEVYVYDGLVTEAEHDSVWYSADDFADFQNELRAAIEYVQQQSNEQAATTSTTLSWSTSLLQVYRILRGVENDDDDDSMKCLVKHLVKATRHAITAEQQQKQHNDNRDDKFSTATTLLGLEHEAHTDLEDDYIVRRRHLLLQTNGLQQHAATLGVTDQQRAAFLYETSRLTSRAARLYAHYVAVLLAATLYE